MARKRKQKVFARFRCSECGQLNYFVRISKRMRAEQRNLELNKFCKWCQHHTVHKESRK